MMAVTQLTLTNYRNHADFEIAPNSAFMVLHGPNGAGKTNILESVSLLVPGRGLRRAPLADISRQGGPGGFTISAVLNGDVQIGTGTGADSPDRRKLRINGANASLNSLSEWLSVLWLTPAMDRIFMEGASGRRRFLDRLTLALTPGHARHASRYEAAMRERNRLLTGEGPADPSWLDAIEARMAEAAVPLAAARSAMVHALDAALAVQPAVPFAVPTLALLADLTQSADQLLSAGGAVGEEQLRSIWKEGRMRDRAAGRTLQGPHRCDFQAHYRKTGQEAAKCSTGEQKALLLSIILAHAALVAEQRGAPPVLLLDEVAAHLDPSRREALFGRLAGLGGQVWMTGTEANLFEAVAGQAQMAAL